MSVRADVGLQIGDSFLMAMNFSDKPEDLTKEEWMDRLHAMRVTRADMNRLIMNYLVTGTTYLFLDNSQVSYDFFGWTINSHQRVIFAEGFKEAAEKFRVESGVQPNIELDGLDDRIKIRDAVQNGRVEDAISLVNSLHPELLDQDRYLYFHLQVANLFNS